MSKSMTDRTLALAGVFQAATQVAQVARTGGVDPGPFETMIRSLCITDPHTTLEVYGSLDHLRPGLEMLVSQLGGDANTAPKRNIEVSRYAIALLHLETKLGKRRDLLNTISEGLAEAERQREHFELTHSNIIARLADTYGNSVSTLTPRIMVNGAHGHLNNPYVAEKVRALLLAGMRSAVLWRQSGGSRWQLLFKRSALIAEARRLLAP